MSKGHTYRDDPMKVSALLEADAMVFASSYFCNGQWPHAGYEAEHKEIRRLAKRMRSLTRVFTSKPKEPKQ